ncbi:ATP phosphoribosyltransferase regulatory subunit [Candidatus Pelagibacter sp.]|nr:ATP phosphoribosyltransferase regulatory subunit [Candidatus Pelagibacter sp.]
MKSENLSNILKLRGFKNIELDSIIETKHILKRSGGNFRQYLFFFYDQRNVEWSLRPDLTLSSVIKFIGTKGKKKTKWSYSGEAYRKQISKKSPIIKQTGFEIFNSKNKEKDDYEIIKTSLDIFKKSKFKICELSLSNIEIFNLLVNKLTSLPLRWREKIQRHFSREIYFDQLLRKLSDNKDINPKLVEQDKLLAEKLRKKDLTKNYSGRSLREILERFDLKNYQDPRNISNKKSVKIIRDYLKISCAIEKAPKILNSFFKKNNLNIFISDDYFPIKKNNIRNVKIIFNPNINRQISYYTGMTFNIKVNFNNKKEIFLSGGRFDNLIKDLGNKKNQNAVGAAINRSIL